MFEVTYKQDNVVKHHINVNKECLGEILDFHRQGILQILNIEDNHHHSYNIENLIKTF